MKIALVYDRVNKFGGAERVLSSLHRIWPEAPIYTAVYNRQTARWADVFRVYPSFLQRVPFARRHHEWFAALTPMAFESFSFDPYDVVLSVSSAESKGIITKPGTMHVCYCLTPTRYLWSGSEEYLHPAGAGASLSVAKAGLRALLPTLKRWDLIAASRPDYYLAISNRVKARIEKYYGRSVVRVIYPPVDTAMFARHGVGGKGGYFLTVSRLVGYKRVDLIVEAFNRLGWPLVIIGDGWEYSRLRAMARPNITLIRGNLTDSELARYYQNSRAFVFAGDEDFGIVAAEAQSAGKPVIAFRQSGVSEIIKDGKTGLLFDEQSVGALVGALKRFDREWYDSVSCSQEAKRFAASRFENDMKAVIEELYSRYKRL